MKQQWFVDKESPFKEISHLVNKTVFETESPYQKIRVLDTYNLSRILVLDDKIQSAQSDEYIYHEALVHPALITHGCPRKVLILGGGEGATLREVLRYALVEAVVMVDIDKVLVDTSKSYLPTWHAGAFEDHRTTLLITDAIDYVENTQDVFDVVICDISDPVEGGLAGRAYTKEFYECVKGILNDDGLFVTQAVEVFYNQEDRHSVVYRTVQSVFQVAESYCEYIPSFGAMWGFVLASHGLSASKNPTLQINRRLKERNPQGLKYYDSETHLRLFSLPKMVREAITKQTQISTRRSPLYVYSG